VSKTVAVFAAFAVLFVLVNVYRRDELKPTSRRLSAATVVAAAATTVDITNATAAATATITTSTNAAAASTTTITNAHEQTTGTRVSRAVTATPADSAKDCKRHFLNANMVIIIIATIPNFKDIIEACFVVKLENKWFRWTEFFTLYAVVFIIIINNIVINANTEAFVCPFILLDRFHS
jgi:hypothetical protein